MKSLLVVLLVVAATEARQVCTPGSTFKQSCNTCHCSSDGLTAACTLMGCPPTGNHQHKIYPSTQLTTEQPKKDGKSHSPRRPGASQVCTPNTTFKQSCNTCFCNSDGTSAACTLMGCPEDNLWKINPAFKLATEKPSNDGALKRGKRSYSKREAGAQQTCIPNTTWKQDCNSCFCNSDGTAAACTAMGCLSKELSIKLATLKPSNEDGASKLEKRSKRETEKRQVCIPNTTFMQSCNSCFCNSEGTDAFCTLKRCLEDSPWTIKPSFDLPTEKPSNDAGALKLSKRSYSTKQSVYGRHCEPGTTVKHYCNTCMCNKLGRIGRCTRMFCDEEVYNEDGTYRISPNGIFKN